MGDITYLRRVPQAQQTREDGKKEPPPDWLIYCCKCGGEDFFIAKPGLKASPSVFCRDCGRERADWF